VRTEFRQTLQESEQWVLYFRELLQHPAARRDLCESRLRSKHPPQRSHGILWQAERFADSAVDALSHWIFG